MNPLPRRSTMQIVTFESTQQASYRMLCSHPLSLIHWFGMVYLSGTTWAIPTRWMMRCLCEICNLVVNKTEFKLNSRQAVCTLAPANMRDARSVRFIFNWIITWRNGHIQCPFALRTTIHSPGTLHLLAAHWTGRPVSRRTSHPLWPGWVDCVAPPW